LPPINGIIETAIHVKDLAASIAFYRDRIGLPVIAGSDRFCALSVASRGVLLLFLEGATGEPVDLPGGRIPPHSGSGALHFAFAVDAASIGDWEQHLTSAGIAIESRVQWELGGSSLYFRDLDGHLVELATPGVWSIY